MINRIRAMPSNVIDRVFNPPLSRTSQIYCLAWLALATLLAVDCVGARLAGLTFLDQGPNAVTVLVLVLFSGLFYLLFGRASRVSTMLRYLALWFAALPLNYIFTYLFVPLNFPPVDIALDQFDRWLGFDWLGWYHFVERHTTVRSALAIAYASIPFQLYFSIVYFSHREESERSNELWWTAMVALVITSVISGALPAMGAFEYYGVVDARHGLHLFELHGLRDGSLTRITFDHLKPIISLPSYHTVLAILLTYVYRRHHSMLYVILPLNVAMLVSIPTQGGHFLADMFAGAAVAAVSIWIVARVRLTLRTVFPK